MRIAITREVSPSVNRCELTHLAREPIDYDRACLQHRQYVEALRSLGLRVEVLPADPDLPDSVFVEDAALVLDECAVLTRPGADSRLPEVEPVAKSLAPYRTLFHIRPPARVDGGDLLHLGRRIHVGQTTRSNAEAVEQMQEVLGRYGYSVKGVPVTGCLHLKSAITQVAADTVLINPAWVNPRDFEGMHFIEVDPSEPFAANAVWIGETLLYPTAFPKTQARLEKAGLRMIRVDADELAKAEGAVTCCSLIFQV